MPVALAQARWEAAPGLTVKLDVPVIRPSVAVKFTVSAFGRLMLAVPTPFVIAGVKQRGRELARQALSGVGGYTSAG